MLPETDIYLSENHRAAWTRLLELLQQNNVYMNDENTVQKIVRQFANEILPNYLKIDEDGTERIVVGNRVLIKFPEEHFNNFKDYQKYHSQNWKWGEDPILQAVAHCLGFRLSIDMPGTNGNHFQTTDDNSCFQDSNGLTQFTGMELKMVNLGRVSRIGNTLNGISGVHWNLKNERILGDGNCMYRCIARVIQKYLPYVLPFLGKTIGDTDIAPLFALSHQQNIGEGNTVNSNRKSTLKTSKLDAALNKKSILKTNESAVPASQKKLNAPVPKKELQASKVEKGFAQLQKAELIEGLEYEEAVVPSQPITKSSSGSFDNDSTVIIKNKISHNIKQIKERAETLEKFSNSDERLIDTIKKNSKVFHLHEEEQKQILQFHEQTAEERQQQAEHYLQTLSHQQLVTLYLKALRIQLDKNHPINKDATSADAPIKWEVLRQIYDEVKANPKSKIDLYLISQPFKYAEEHTANFFNDENALRRVLAKEAWRDPKGFEEVKKFLQSQNKLSNASTSALFQPAKPVSATDAETQNNVLSEHNMVSVRA